MDYLSIAKQHRQQLIDDVIEVVSYPSLKDENTIADGMPFGKACHDVLEYMLAKADKDGFKTENVDGYAGVITYGDHQESVSMLGHLDVVPVDASEWDSHPFEVYEKDGYLVGRGTGDDKGPTMAAYLALKMLKENNVQLKRNIQLIVGVDEESGMQCMAYFKQHHKLPLMGIVPDADFPVVYGEKGILNLTFSGDITTKIVSASAGKRANVVIGQATFEVKGELKQAEFEVFLAMNQLTGECSFNNGISTYTLFGKNYHASMSHKGANAALFGLQFIGGFYQDDFALNLYNLLKNPFGDGLEISFDGAYMGPVTLNTGILNIANQQISLTLDVRYPNECDGVQLIEKIKQKLATLNLNCVKSSNSNPLFVDPQSTLIKTCMAAYQEVSQDYETPAITMGGGTYARTLENHVAFGAVFPKDIVPEWVGGPHEKNEAVSIDGLIKSAAIYAKVMEQLANAD